MKKGSALWISIVLLFTMAATSVFAAPRTPRIAGLPVTTVLPIGFPAVMDSLNSIDSSIARTKVIKGLKRVYRCNLNEDDGTPLWRQTQEAFDHAEQMNADYIFIQVNPGSSISPNRFRAKILGSNVPVMMFFDNNSVSAGALISLSADSSRSKSSKKNTTIDRKNNTTGTLKNNRSIDAAANSTPVYPGDTRSNSTTGLSSRSIFPEAPGYEGVAASMDEVMQVAGIGNYEMVEYQPTVVEKLSRSLSNPFISGMLIMLIIGGIYFEMKRQGNGFAGLVAITAALAYFAPLYLQELAASWEILLFLLGVVLIGIERSMLRKTGITGIAGIVLIALGLALSLVDHQPSGSVLDLPYAPAFARSLITVSVSITLSLLLSAWLSSKRSRTPGKAGITS